MIAQAAGVTTATVSYVLNNDPKQSISEETRERVLKAAKELCYVPNAVAKSLRNQRSMCVAVAIEKDLSFSRFAQTLQGIRFELEQHGYSMLLCTFQKRNALYPDYVNRYLEKRVDGVIYMAKDNLPPDEEAETYIRKFDIPFVAFDCQSKNHAFCTVDFDYYTNAVEVTRQLFARTGAKRLIYLRPSANNEQETQRENGIRTAMGNVPGSELQVIQWNSQQDYTDELSLSIATLSQEHARKQQEASLHQAFQALLRQVQDGDIVLSSWGVLILAVQNLLKHRKIFWGALADVPSIHGEPGVYTHLPNESAGKKCAELLMKQIKKEKADSVLVSLPFFEL